MEPGKQEMTPSTKIETGYTIVDVLILLIGQKEIFTRPSIVNQLESYREHYDLILLLITTL